MGLHDDSGFTADLAVPDFVSGMTGFYAVFHLPEIEGTHFLDRLAPSYFKFNTFEGTGPAVPP